MDVIHLAGIEVFAHHGVFEHEKINGQRFVVDVDVEFDASRAIMTDSVEDTLNYAELAQLVHDEVQRDPMDLLEAVAFRVIRSVFDAYPAERVTVTIHKPDVDMPVMLDQVAVTISRARNEVG